MSRRVSSLEHHRNPVRQVVILVIIYVETFKTDVIIFIGNVMMCLMSQCQYHEVFGS
jgi:hypothetical protein